MSFSNSITVCPGKTVDFQTSKIFEDKFQIHEFTFRYFRSLNPGARDRVSNMFESWILARGTWADFWDRHCLQTCLKVRNPAGDLGKFLKMELPSNIFEVWIPAGDLGKFLKMELPSNIFEVCRRLGQIFEIEIAFKHFLPQMKFFMCLHIYSNLHNINEWSGGRAPSNQHSSTVTILAGSLSVEPTAYELCRSSICWIATAYESQPVIGGQTVTERCHRWFTHPGASYCKGRIDTS